MKRICERLQSGVYQPGEYFPLGVPLLRIACVAKNCPEQTVKNKGFSSRMLLPLLLQLSVFQLGMCALHHPRPPLFPLHSQWGTKRPHLQQPPHPLWPSTFANQLKITIGTDHHQEFSQGWKLTPLFLQELGRRLLKLAFQRNPLSIVLQFYFFIYSSIYMYY